VGMASDLRPRLERCAEQVRVLEAEKAAELERRNSLVRRAIAEGNTFRSVARAAGLSVGRVAAIVGMSVETADALKGAGSIF
jgi:hypothetical protein